MPVRTDIAMIAERIIVFMIVLLESLVHTVAGLGARISDMAHFAAANRCCHAPVTNSESCVAQFPLPAGTTARTI
jgi:hypothetical protein